MLSLTCIILTFNERKHIARCIEGIKPIASRIIVVDSHSTDETQEIARSLGAEVIEHDWPGNQAAQFNWAIDNIPVDTDWIIRLDADEYMQPTLIAELQELLPNLPAEVTAVSMPRAKAFRGRMLKHGISKTTELVRIFRPGTARYENRIMDEHLQVLKGSTVKTSNIFVDDNLMPISDFIIKHVDYANREALMLFAQEQGQADSNSGATADQLDESAAKKRRQKSRYARMPLYWRAFGYFIYRYFFRLGFLDGREGFLWDFIQGWWYRTLVDARLEELRQEHKQEQPQ